ncbi:MAG: class I SAM-dependent methyltransferase [Pseudomonadota bacterium]
MTSKSNTRKRAKTLAEKADKFVCYQEAVQSPDADIEFFEQAYKDAFGAKPLTLREDFCGTFAVSCEWAKSSRKRSAIGVDLCATTLQWGRENNLTDLSPAQQMRVAVYEKDVRWNSETKSDVLAAQNFSFWIFKTRAELIEYFRSARANLNDKGVMVMDMTGGEQIYSEEFTEKRVIAKGRNGFSYHWEQARFNPINAHGQCYIHFRFADGSKLKRAFEYEWRYWTIPEVREMLEEAGFSKSVVYWETEDENGEDTGEWEATEDAPSHPSWICYLVAIK